MCIHVYFTTCTVHRYIAMLLRYGSFELKELLTYLGLLFVL